MSAVIVWSKPRCVQCTAVYRAFTRGGVAYETRNLPDFPEKLAEFIEAGHSSAPVVEAQGFDTFAGFNPDAIAEIVAAHGVDDK